MATTILSRRGRAFLLASLGALAVDRVVYSLLLEFRLVFVVDRAACHLPSSYRTSSTFDPPTKVCKCIRILRRLYSSSNPMCTILRKTIRIDAHEEHNYPSPRRVSPLGNNSIWRL